MRVNDVMASSAGSSLFYGAGRGEGCKYVYRGLDLATGKAALSLPLDRSFIFGVFNDEARIRPVKDIP